MAKKAAKKATKRPTATKAAARKSRPRSKKRSDRLSPTAEARREARSDRRTPVHPLSPNPMGSAPEPNSVPTGPMDENVVYRTDDIDASGRPLIQPNDVEPSPHIDGYAYTPDEEAARRAQRSTEIEQVESEFPDTAPTPEGVRLDTKKKGRPIELARPEDDDFADVTRETFENPTQPIYRTRD